MTRNHDPTSNGVAGLTGMVAGALEIKYRNKPANKVPMNAVIKVGRPMTTVVTVKSPTVMVAK